MRQILYKSTCECLVNLFFQEKIPIGVRYRCGTHLLIHTIKYPPVWGLVQLASLNYLISLFYLSFGRLCSESLCECNFLLGFCLDCMLGKILIVVDLEFYSCKGWKEEMWINFTDKGNVSKIIQYDFLELCLY